MGIAIIIQEAVKKELKDKGDTVDFFVATLQDLQNEFNSMLSGLADDNSLKRFLMLFDEVNLSEPAYFTKVQKLIV